MPKSNNNNNKNKKKEEEETQIEDEINQTKRLEDLLRFILGSRRRRTHFLILPFGKLSEDLSICETLGSLLLDHNLLFLLVDDRARSHMRERNRKQEKEETDSKALVQGRLERVANTP